MPTLDLNCTIDSLSQTGVILGGDFDLEVLGSMSWTGGTQGGTGTTRVGGGPTVSGGRDEVPGGHADAGAGRRDQRLEPGCDLPGDRRGDLPQ